MADSRDEQKATYPLPAYNFRVTVGDETMSFAEVSGISLEYETLTYKHGMSFWEGEGVKRYSYAKFVPVTLSKGTVAGTNVLYEWIYERENAIRPIDVSLCDENGVPVVTWRMEKAMPVKLDAPTFAADSNDVAIESLEILAGGISVIHH